MSTAPKNAIAQFLANIASGKAALVTAQAELATANALVLDLQTSEGLLKTELAALKITHAALEVSHSEERSAHSNLISAHAAFCASLGFAPADLAGKTELELQNAFAARVSTQATEQLANLGFDPAKLPAPIEASSAKSKILSYAEFSALTPAGKMEFSSNGGRIEG